MTEALEKVRIQGTDQWLLIRGESSANPILLMIQAGPGLPMINEAPRFRRTLALESEFTVVYWDARGCGKSFSSETPRASMTLEQLVKDTRELTAYLKTRFSTSKVFLAGFSMGGTIAMLAAAEEPQSYHAVTAIGPDIDGADGGKFAYEFALAQARARGNRSAERELMKLGPAPHLTASAFATRVKWVVNFGGIERDATYATIFKDTIGSLLKSPHYSWLDLVRTVRGISFCQGAMVAEMAEWNLFEKLTALSVPLWIFQGRRDKAANPSVAERFIAEVRSSAPKSLVWFEKSAHSPHWEESAKFRHELIRAKMNVLGEARAGRVNYQN